MTRLTPFPQEHRKLDLFTIASLAAMLWVVLIAIALIVL